ncbi:MULTISPECIES: DUF6646 family protein [Bizionia]|uniref:Porin family protein n=1 Tax=Bizionia algoritergicola TaxID=291187 RepID=A0A5D0R317_9FLAO|nr:MULTISPECIES: DUF6646 family protein [Bizionia]OBX23524.1 hypothetical protein BAA08_04000 [Bizionia sp. APA-3]TYB74944.1 hypothetical protein ES675_02065 [Bizionia algoritergicola]
MKKLLVVAAILTVSFANAQAFSGKGDQKFQVGANFQSHATGLNVSYDYGLGENISVGISSSYALGVSGDLQDGVKEPITGITLVDKAGFDDRFDLKARFNANIGNVLKIDENFDLYPGLSFSMKNFGGHLGARYFFTTGFGIYTEAQFPIAKYKDNLTPSQELNNQFSMNLGAVFNL